MVELSCTTVSQCHSDAGEIISNSPPPSWEDVLEGSRHKWHGYTQQKGRASLMNVTFHHEQLRCTAWLSKGWEPVPSSRSTSSGTNLEGNSTLDQAFKEQQNKPSFRKLNLYIHLHYFAPVFTSTTPMIQISQAIFTHSFHLCFLAF